MFFTWFCALFTVKKPGHEGLNAQLLCKCLGSFEMLVVSNCLLVSHWYRLSFPEHRKVEEIHLSILVKINNWCMNWVNLIEVLQQWVRECSHIQLCWFCRHCSSNSQKRLPFFRVTVSDDTWLFSVSSCVHVNSLLGSTESFSSVVLVWVWGATQEIAIPDYILWWKKLVHCFFEIVPEIALALWDPVWPKVIVKCTFLPFW